MKKTNNSSANVDFNPEEKEWFSPKEIGEAFDRVPDTIRRLVTLERIRCEPKNDPSDKHEPVRIPASEARRLVDTNFELLPLNPDKLTLSERARYDLVDRSERSP